MEDVKKLFIVDEKDFSSKQAEELVGDIVAFVRVSKEGKVIFLKTDMKNSEKIALTIFARFLANQLEKSIPAEVQMREVMEATSLPQDIISARLSELINQRFVKRVETGVYAAIPYRAEVYIDKIKKAYTTKK